jgi:hypothetical protein
MERDAVPVGGRLRRTVGTAGGNAGIGDRVSLEFNKFEDNLKLGGFMLNGSWRDGRWTAFGD